MEANMRTMMGRLGFTDAASAAIVNADQQGCNTLEIMATLSKQDILDMLANVRKPGGTVADGAGNQVPNRGQNVSCIAETCLCKAVYFVCHKYQCSDAVEPANITAASVQALQTLINQEEAHKGRTHRQT